MAKSIRISDQLYRQAQANAALMHRSLNQQIEYWVALGQLLDKQLTADDAEAAMIALGHVLDEEAVKSGFLRQEDLFVFKPGDSKRINVQFSATSLENFEF